MDQVPQERGTGKRPYSPEPSCVSFKSDQSIPIFTNFNDGKTPQESGTGKRPHCPEPSCVSFKSEQSMPIFTNFNDGTTPQKSGTGKRPHSPEPSCVSFKSEQSMPIFTNFNDETTPQKRSPKQNPKINKSSLNSIFKELENKTIILLKNELNRFKKLLSTDYPACSEEQEEEEDLQCIKEGVLKITLQVLKTMKQKDLAHRLQIKLAPVYQRKLKSKLLEKCRRINEGISQHGTSTLLNEIYTDLYITESWSGDVNDEHEVRQIQTASRRPETEETPIKCNDLFKDKSIRSVLTKGVAGIGKTVSVQKFILDWAEGKVNQDVLFLFPLPFRELNLVKQENFSLMNLLHRFCPEIKDLEVIDSDAYKVLFIFDGLDECRLPLNFQNNEMLFDVTESVAVDVLLTNLIKGNLLPSALLWITTRPAAASQIPPECVDQVTEVRGFNDPQKEEYFMKRISDQSLSNAIITHVKSSRSLFIMCHIPVFCWISATVLERMLGEAEGGEIPKTLTQMFTHFLIFQIKYKEQKYHQKSDIDLPQTRESILALGKLAFQQLDKGNLMFYEEDLRECGIDVTEVAVYSGVCTQIFRTESGLHLGRMFSFVHLSVQEFLASLFAFLCFLDKQIPKEQTTNLSGLFNTSEMSEFLRSAVDQALLSENGHLDLFLRFLLGLSVESNQKLIGGLLTHTGSSSDCQKDIVQYIKFKFEQNPSPERLINLFYCLNELHDDSLVKEIQSYMNSGRLSETELSPAQWSALVFVLLTSEEDLEVFELQKFIRSDECFKRLIPVVQQATRALLSECNLTERSCSTLQTVLSSESSKLTEVDLSRNPLEDSGVKLLCAALKSPNCKLETLSLLKSADAAEALRSLSKIVGEDPLLHRELDLSRTTPGDVNVKNLSALLQDPHYRLQKLTLYKEGSIKEDDCVGLFSALDLNPSHLRELNLNWNKPGESGLRNLCDFLKNPECKLQKLQLGNRISHKFLSRLQNSISGESCADVASALCTNPSHIRDLDLSWCKLGDSGVKKLCDLLKKHECKLETLRLQNSISDESCADVASALCTNPSHIRDLDLSECKLGDSGVKKLCDLLKKHECKLETLRLRDCSITDGGAALTEALRLNSSHLKELNLSWNKLKDSVLHELQEILQSSGGKLQYHKSWTQKVTAAAACNPITGSKSDEQTTSQGCTVM
ncbi:NACHT, LRR and PYD domains-containing protein 3-like isoform X12 [Silurus meridionalis]|uniref:NACHT, LRR and PYD domains-containing protein 3-like isoform X12 n=1 Tax=Silurus meridionalis TaxID=175797 RepID=UPI001EE9EBB5|nr:NACHT, LRR and PYD domains-containing protein 3-like isoform X12 [Silurus meridionalis]